MTSVFCHNEPGNDVLVVMHPERQSKILSVTKNSVILFHRLPVPRSFDSPHYISAYSVKIFRIVAGILVQSN